MKITSFKLNSQIQVPSAVFWISIGLRIILPPIFFLKLHPFLATILTEVLCDGIISPHHHILFFKYPYNYRKISIYLYDKPLDYWGQLCALYPIIFKSSLYYNIFGSRKGLLYGLFAFRTIGNLAFIISRSIKMFIIFPNLFFSVYILITSFEYFNIHEGDKWFYILLPLVILFTILKEYIIHGKNHDMLWKDVDMNRSLKIFKETILLGIPCLPIPKQ